ncbi:protein disulfide oxidoreductase [Faucicola mancuniensis]|uniref:protein disulfide oxidoreductase n=1 Tax=Faucicola mancuniensis TaxID=1309795 RepID=UPI0028EABCB6|nr:protein disulfide oxidoreductase [uncultured Moraxella sp.]
MKNILLLKNLGQFCKNAVVYLLMFIVIYSVVNWWRQPNMPIEPNLKFSSIQGHRIDINQLSHGQPVLIYFWGTWCGVCRQTSPSVNKLAHNSQYPVISIAVQSGENQAIQQYMNDKNLDFITVNDEQGQVFKDWQGQVTPSYVILQDGKMVQGFTGIQPAWVLNMRLKFAQVFS